MKHIIMLSIAAVMSLTLMACESPAEKQEREREKAAIEQQNDMKETQNNGTQNTDADQNNKAEPQMNNQSDTDTMDN